MVQILYSSVETNKTGEEILLPVTMMAALLSTCCSLGQGEPVTVITKETHLAAGSEHFIMSLDN